jgi:succinylglutamic semialdehyde dehydrogenase
MRTELSSYIFNKWVAGEGNQITSTNPRNGDIIFDSSFMTEDRIDTCLKAAKKGFHHWKNTPYSKRKAFIVTIKNSLNKHKETLIETLKQDVGKTHIEAEQEIQGMINKIDLSIQAHETRNQSCLIGNENGIKKEIVRHPLGVLLIVAPFNFPGHLPHGQIIPALLSGNSVILKPSVETPLFSITYTKIMASVGLPPGVFNMALTDDNATKKLSTHKDLNGVMFTGSSDVGTKILNQMSCSPEKMVMLEMGGNNPLIISQYQNDLLHATYIATISALISSGQRCTCARRIIVNQDILYDVVLYMKQFMTRLKYSTNINDRYFLPPLISKKSLEQFQKHIEMIKPYVKNTIHITENTPQQGYFAPIHCYEMSDMIDEECFGPLIQIQSYERFDEAIQLANKTEYGLGSTLLSHNDDEINVFKEKIHCGVMNINTYSVGAAGTMPFGGVGKSGNFRPAGFYTCDSTSYTQSVQTNDTIAKTIPLGGYSEKLF